MTCNELKRMFKKEGIRMWQIAELLQIHEVTFGRWFRHENMPKDKELQILAAVEEIRLNRCKGNDRPEQEEPFTSAAQTLAEAVNSIKVQRPVRDLAQPLDDTIAF